MSRDMESDLKTHETEVSFVLQHLNDPGKIQIPFTFKVGKRFMMQITERLNIFRLTMVIKLIHIAYFQV